jgi:hypothetical protein
MRGQCILVIAEHMIQLVRIFACDMAQRGAGEVAGDVLGQVGHAITPTAGSPQCR